MSRRLVARSLNNTVFIMDLDTLKFIARMDDDLSRFKQIRIADFIVKACNMYSELRESLQDIIRDIRLSEGCDPEEWCRRYNRAVDAVARAEQ